MTILITGGRGLLGSALSQHLRKQGHCVVIASRSATDDDVISWSPNEGKIDLSSLDSLDAVIHLAGENLADGRWSKAKKERILESRRLGTRTIAQAIAAMPHKPRVMISASGVNYYPSNTGKIMTETSVKGDDFLAHVCSVWEAETAPAEEAGIRVMHARLGVVLTPEGGALAKMLPVFKLGLGGVLGTGRQRMSWIGLEDVVALFDQALEDERFTGPINVVAPDIVTNAEFTKALATSVGKRAFFLPVPALVLKLMFGEMAGATLLADLAVKPGRLEEMGYTFKAGSLEKAL
jgi:uncharacterized protein (TIGR01777 family)